MTDAFDPSYSPRLFRLDNDFISIVVRQNGATIAGLSAAVLESVDAGRPMSGQWWALEHTSRNDRMDQRTRQ